MFVTDRSLELEEYRRYGRQMILPEVGLAGQLRLHNASILVVGAGGLGCPAIAYLAGAGIGRIGVIDGDTIDLSNCHRQILHSPRRAGSCKVDSVREFVTELNANVTLDTYAYHLKPHHAIELFSKYDLILDCSDNQETRYLISDTCVVLKLPLISGSALKTEGQLAVYNYKGGPCYRCLFPVPAPSISLQSCGDFGIMGPVVGTIGLLQALETIKILLRDDSGVAETKHIYEPSMTLFSPFGPIQWRNVKLRKKKNGCAACGPEPTITQAIITGGGPKYERLIRSLETQTKVQLSLEDRIDPECLQRHLEDYKIIDVRNKTQFDVAALPHSINVPLEQIDDLELNDHSRDVLVVCRSGDDSQAAVKLLRHKYPKMQVKDLKGGLRAYSTVDATFPVY